MTDIVRIFEDYATTAGYQYEYGQQTVINLFENGDGWIGDSDTIYFMHEFRKGHRVDNNTMRYDGVFYLVVHSDMNQNFFQEVGAQSEGKYQNNIEPLINAYDSMWKHFYCTQMEVISASFIDVTDFLDANMDGIKIDYSVKYINSFNIN